MKCPCCGQEVDTVGINDLTGVGMGEVPLKLLYGLLRAFPEGVSAEVFADMHGMTPNHVHVAMRKLRQAIEPHGWTVKSKPGPGRNPYKLERIDP